jgi:Holliday junction resolvase RusA-like endonuclease
MKPTITFFVVGEPKGQPRPRAFARKFGDKWQARVYDAKTAEGWKGQIASGWQHAKPDDFTPFTGAVSLEITFKIPRPKSHYLKSGLRDTAPLYCTKKPDADNYAKAAMDALTVLGAWHDDSQVCDLKVVKMFSDGMPGALIVLKELDEHP